MMRSTLDVGRLVASVVPALARPAPLAGGVTEPPVPGAGRAGAGPAAAPAHDAWRAELLRRALEEWGIRCRERPELQTLEAFGVISARGVEITIAADLSAADRALAYARCLARLVLHDDRQFATWFHYRAGLTPGHLSAAERRSSAVVDAMARALLGGRLQAAPRYLLPTASPEVSAASGLLGDCSRALLVRLHRASSALYWRSDSYQALRATAPMVRLTSRVHDLLSAAGPQRAA
ncbi:MAG TPA: hypothetical protein VFE37_08870 [Chloroflexota bacterium]|nr:hypothetical protein [Chloroflexota bacterium]